MGLYTGNPIVYKNTLSVAGAGWTIPFNNSWCEIEIYLAGVNSDATWDARLFLLANGLTTNAFSQWYGASGGAASIGTQAYPRVAVIGPSSHFTFKINVFNEPGKQRFAISHNFYVVGGPAMGSYTYTSWWNDSATVLTSLQLLTDRTTPIAATPVSFAIGSLCEVSLIR